MGVISAAYPASYISKTICAISLQQILLVMNTVVRSQNA
jgi:hypothetical protein